MKVAHLSAIGAESGHSGLDTGAEYPEPFLETEQYRWRIIQRIHYINTFIFHKSKVKVAHWWKLSLSINARADKRHLQNSARANKALTLCKSQKRIWHVSFPLRCVASRCSFTTGSQYSKKTLRDTADRNKSRIIHLGQSFGLLHAQISNSSAHDATRATE